MTDDGKVDFMDGKKTTPGGVLNKYDTTDF